MVYSWTEDLLSLPKEQILLTLLAVLGDSHASVDEAAAAIQESGGQISCFRGKEIHVDLSREELDFSGFARVYGSSMLENAIMEMLVTAIHSNSYLSVLEDACREFGLFGRYMKYESTDDPIYKGVYFVCGYNLKTVTDPDLNISNIVKTQYGASRLRLDIHAEKVGGTCPYAVHQKTVHYCLNASTIRMLCHRFGVPCIDACSAWFVKNIHMLCRNAFSNKLDPVGRGENKIALGNFFPRQSNVELAFAGRGDPLNYMIHTAPERIPLFKKDGMVKMETLVEHVFKLSNVKFSDPPKGSNESNHQGFMKLLYSTHRVSALTLSTAEGKALQTLLTESYPHILFSVAQSNEGMTVFYESLHGAQFQQATVHARKSHLFARSYQLEQLERETASYYCIGVHLEDLDLLFSRADRAGLRLCINTKRNQFAHNATAADVESGNYICAVSYPMEQDAMMDAILADVRIRVYYRTEMNREKTCGLFVPYTSLEAVGAVKRWLAANPEIRYFQAKPVASSLSGTAAKTGFGSAAANRFSSIFFAIDARYEEQAECAFLKARHPEYFKYTPSDIRKLGGTASVAVPSGDLPRLFQTAQDYDLPVCVDPDRVLHGIIDPKHGISDSTYTLMFPTAHTAQWESILWQIAEIDRNDRLVKPDDLNIYG